MTKISFSFRGSQAILLSLCLGFFSLASCGNSSDQDGELRQTAGSSYGGGNFMDFGAYFCSGYALFKKLPKKGGAYGFDGKIIDSCSQTCASFFGSPKACQVGSIPNPGKSK